MNKPGKSFPRPLADLLHKTLTDAFARQGFASSELVTRWADIVGAEIAAHSEPEKIQWTRGADGHTPEPGTLVLRVEGPTAIEIQHLSGVVLERVNRFFGWQAVQDGLKVGLDVAEFVGLQDVLEDVEAAAPIGVQDVGMHRAAGGEADGTAVAEVEGTLLAVAEVGAHGGFLGTVVDGQDRFVHLVSSSASGALGCKA